jgi:predicted nucleotidyltransferase
MTELDPATESAVKTFAALIVHRWNVVGVILYGSRARGDHHSESDVDVAVLLNGDHQPFLFTKLAMSDVAYDVLLETGLNISPLPVWMDEWEHPEGYSNPELLRNIARDRIRL